MLISNSKGHVVNLTNKLHSKSMIVVKTTTMIMSLLTNFYLNTIRLWFSPSIIYNAHSSSQKRGSSLKSLPRNSHRNKNYLFNTYPLAMQPSGCAFCWTYIFRVFTYYLKEKHPPCKYDIR